MLSKSSPDIVEKAPATLAWRLNSGTVIVPLAKHVRSSSYIYPPLRGAFASPAEEARHRGAAGLLHSPQTHEPQTPYYGALAS